MRTNLKKEELRAIIDALEGVCQEMEAGHRFMPAPAIGGLGHPDEELLLLRIPLPRCLVVRLSRRCDLAVVATEPVFHWRRGAGKNL